MTRTGRPNLNDLSTAPEPPVTGPSEEALDRLILPGCREQMRREIAEVKGAEVYFIGRLNPELAVEEVEAYAFGNRHAVPALMQYARPGDIVIHNHPSGQLEPSDADISVSSELGGRGIGSYIVNNDISAIRIVVKAFKSAGLTPIDISVLQNWLRAGGRIAESMDGYEERPEQLDMLRAVGESFNMDGIAVIEAGTGTGKSLAYLLPAIAWALKNGEKVVISTGTINLQEQLLEKDIPLLLKASGLKFEASLLKGRNNYLCQRKADYLKKNPTFLDVGEKADQLAEIQEWIKTTSEGSLSALPFSPDRDVWERVMSEGDNCLRTKCPFYQKCFFYNARRRAARAQLLVVNHHLLMADLAIRAETNNYTVAAALPPFHRIIIDEAHHLEEVATDYFGSRASRSYLHYALRRLVNPRTGEGLLSFLAGKIHAGLYTLMAAEMDELIVKLTRDLPLLHHELRYAMDTAAEQMAEALERSSNVPLSQPLEVKRRITDADMESRFWTESVEPPLRAVLTAARPYLEGLREVGRTLARFLEDATPEAATPILELQSALNKVESIITSFIRFLGDTEGQCRWIEYRRRPTGRSPEVVYSIAPLNIAMELRDRVLRRFKTVVMTSATLTVERKFDFFLRQIGADDPLQLGLMGSAATAPSAAQSAPCPSGDAPSGAPPKRMAGEFADDAPDADLPEELLPRQADDPADPALSPPTARRIESLLLDTPFDFERQVYIGVPMDMADPTSSAFDTDLIEFLGPALEASRGRAFVLFTAYSLLERVFRQLAPRLERKGYPCLRQGQTGRSILTESFRRDIGSVLFATSSFWEGVDVQGEALSCLVLTRLPFRVPGEPLIEARIEALRERGMDPFYHLIVPQAVIRFRQGFGRLIRSRSDRGAILICDRRVMNKTYGQLFLRSLPTQSIHYGQRKDVLEQLGNFFASEQGWTGDE